MEENKPDTIQFGDPELSDVTITVKEGEKEQQFIKANKMVLANSSDVFKRMFLGDFKEAAEGHVEIKDVPIDSFRRLAEIIYDGKPSDFDIFEGGGYYKEECLFESKKDFYFYIRSFRHNKPLDKVTIQKFWFYVQGLLTVADRFNVTEAVMKYYQEAISRNYCSDKNCFFCLNLFLFTRVYKLSYGEDHPKFTMFNYKTWESHMQDFPGSKRDIGFPTMNEFETFCKIFD